MFQRNASKFVTYKNPCISFIFQIVQLCTNLYPMKALVYVDHKYISCMTWKTKISAPFLYIKCRKSLFIISIKNLATTFLIENWQVQYQSVHCVPVRILKKSAIPLSLYVEIHELFFRKSFNSGDGRTNLSVLYHYIGILKCKSV